MPRPAVLSPAVAILRAPDLTDEEGARPNALFEIPAGPAGVRATLSAMVRLTKIYRTTLPIRDAAERITAGVMEKDSWGEVAAVQAWVRDAVRYTSDVFDVETLKTPLETLRSISGDCDDKALLAGTILQSIGFAVRYVAVGYEAPDRFEHVYAEVKLGRPPNEKWIAVETTEPVSLGWAPPDPVAYMRAVV